MSVPPRPPGLAIRRVHPESPEARYCLNLYYAELDRRFPGGFNASESLPAPPASLLPPKGAFLVAVAGEQVLGSGAVRVLGAGIGSIKRMWVAEGARGRGVGRRLLLSLEAEAERLGVRTVRLETNRALTEAVRLYSSSGYHEVAPFNEDPYADHWFEKDLAGR